MANQSGPPPSAYALQSIPSARLTIYEQAGQRFNIDWTFLASIGTQECDTGDCAGDNGFGCAGPMQIAFKRGTPCSPGSEPTLWERYAVSTHPGQPANINDPADAVYTAARILREDKGAPPIGGSYAQYHQAACNYYGSCSYIVAYADEVMARAVQYGFNGTGAPAATSPQLAQPVTTGQAQCSASTIAPEAASAQAIVKIAESQVGQGEHPAGSNCTMYGPCEEWCSLFAAWVWQHARAPLPGPTSLYGYSGGATNGQETTVAAFCQRRHGPRLRRLLRHRPNRKRARRDRRACPAQRTDRNGRGQLCRPGQPRRPILTKQSHRRARRDLRLCPTTRTEAVTRAWFCRSM